MRNKAEVEAEDPSRLKYRLGYVLSPSLFHDP